VSGTASLGLSSASLAMKRLKPGESIGFPDVSTMASSFLKFSWVFPPPNCLMNSVFPLTEMTFVFSYFCSVSVTTVFVIVVLVGEDDVEE